MENIGFLADGSGPWGQRPSDRPPSTPPGNSGVDFDAALAKVQNRLKNLFSGGRAPFGVLFVLVLVVAGWLATGFYTVNPKEQGVELVFGKLYETTGPGLHYNFPAPIGEVLLPRVTTVRQTDIGFRTGRSGSIPEESQMLTGDENIIEVQYSVFSRISDPVQYLFNIRNPERSVRNVAEAAMREVIGKTNFGYARTKGRSQVATSVQTLMQGILDRYGTGVKVVNVNLRRVDPPEVVLDAFRDVQAARADKERSLNVAMAYSNEVIEKARGQASQITQEAVAYKQERIEAAVGDTKRFLSVLAQYKANPEITRRLIYLSTLEEVLGHTKKVLFNGNVGGRTFPLLNLNTLLKGKN